MKTLTKHLVPNAGTLILVGLLFVAQSVGALPGAAPVELLVASQPLISYQGTLTDPSGNPVNGLVTMEFALYDADWNGAMKWGPELQIIQVNNGQFRVLLGSVASIDPANLTGDLWLDVKVNGEQLSPRERLAGVVYAFGGMGNKFTVNGSLLVSAEAGSANAGFVSLENATSGNKWQMTTRSADNDNLHYYFWDAGTALWTLAMKLTRNGTVVAPRLQTSAGATIGLQDTGGGQLIVANNPNDNRIYLEAFSSDLSGSATELLLTGKNAQNVPLLSLFATETRTTGILNMNGNSVVNCGALTEANLQTEEELAAGRIDRFEEGDILCWGDDQLEKCTQAGDVLVQAVADANGRPIVIGAELVKVIGPVKKGEFLVASDVPGYAIATSSPEFGTVIAQALEDFNGERGIIKAMIRKL